jgi:sec-independent protein translocase protein TatB
MFFNIGPLELIVLAFVGLIVLGPERVPGLAKDAGRLLRELRDMATGARTQIREELGPELADLDLRSLNPRTMITQAILGDDIAPGALSGRGAFQRLLDGGSDTPATGATGANGAAGTGGGEAAPAVKPVSAADRPFDRPDERPLGRGEAAPFDADAT